MSTTAQKANKAKKANKATKSNTKTTATAPATEPRVNSYLAIVKAFVEAENQTLDIDAIAEISTSSERVTKDISKVRKDYKLNIASIKENGNKVSAYKMKTVKSAIALLEKNEIEFTYTEPVKVVAPPKYKATKASYALLPAPEGEAPASPYASEAEEVSIVEMTPAEAHQILSFHNTNNRFPTVSRVQKYIESMGGVFTVGGAKVNDMALYQNDEKALEHYGENLHRTESNWLLNNDAISFNQAGILSNGQHRLWAIVLSNTTQPFIVFKGASEESFATMDYGKLRNSADVLFISQANEGDERLHSQLSKLVASALQWARAYKENVSDKLIKDRSAKLSRVTTDNFSMTEVIENYRGLTESAKFVHALVNLDKIKERNVKPSDVALNDTDIVFLHYQVAQIDATVADEFIKALLTGWDIDSDGPIAILRDWLFQVVGNQKKHRTTAKQEIFRRVAIAWNKHIHGEELVIKTLQDNKHTKETASQKVRAFPVFQSKAMTAEDVEIAEANEAEASTATEEVAEVEATEEA